MKLRALAGCIALVFSSAAALAAPAIVVTARSGASGAPVRLADGVVDRARHALSVDAQGNTYVAASQRVAGNWRYLTSKFLPDGSLAFTRGHAVWRRTADGRANPLAGSPAESGTADGPAADARFDRPLGLACDEAGGIYVADYWNHTVRYIDARRSVRTVLGTAGQRGHAVGTLPGLLDNPSSLVLVPGWSGKP